MCFPPKGGDKSMILFLCKVIQSESLLATWLPCRGSCRRLRGQRKQYETLNVRQSSSVLPAPSSKNVHIYPLYRQERFLPSTLDMFIAKYTATASPSCILPRRGNAVKLRICVSRYDSTSSDRLLKFLRLLRLLRFSECADRR